MIVGVSFFLLLLGTAGAAGFPENPIQVLVGWPVGNVNDMLDRVIAEPLSEILKQPVLVQNVPGGGGAVVLGKVKIEKPDGYTLFQTGSIAYSQVPWLRTVPFDPLKDFEFLASHAQIEAYLLCRSDSPWKTYEELIKYVKENPKKVTFASPGVNSALHLMMEYLAMKENLQWRHVPYQGSSQAFAALLGGHADLAPLSIGTELEYVKTGKFRPLVILSKNRSKRLPDLPTVGEKGYDFSVKIAFTWSVPADTPADVKNILEKALLQSFEDPRVQDAMEKQKVTYIPLGSKETTGLVSDDHQKFGELMKKFGLGIFKK